MFCENSAAEQTWELELGVQFLIEIETAVESSLNSFAVWRQVVWLWLELGSDLVSKQLLWP